MPPGRAWPGLFVAFEGGDGAGKGTALAAVSATLTATGHQVLQTREPGGTEEGQSLRALLLGQSGSVWQQQAELLLMTAARVQHVTRIILPALAAGRIVLCDRYAGSTLAYQGGGRGIDPAFIRTLHREAVNDIWPDLTLLLDIDPAIALPRSRARLTATQTDEGRFESLDLPFHQRVRATYTNLAATLPGWHVIDATSPPETVAATAQALIAAHL